MDNTIEIASNARSAVSALIRRLLVAYRVAETPQSQRDFLLQLRAVNETVALIEPLTRFNRFTELEELDVSAAEMAELLSGYRTNPTRRKDLFCASPELRIARAGDRPSGRGRTSPSNDSRSSAR